MQKTCDVAGMAFLAKKMAENLALKLPKIAKIWPKNGLKWPKIAKIWMHVYIQLSPED